MTQYSYAGLEQLWDKAGGDPTKAPIAAAIAEAESSGRSNAESGNPDGGTNVGLWQLDTPGGKGAGWSIGQLLNPATNAAVAVKGSSNGRDWSAWQTYVQGTYLQYLGGKNTGGGNSSGSSPPPSSGGPSASSNSGQKPVVWYEPWTWPNAASNAVGSATSGVEQFAVHYAAVGLVVVAGLGLIVAGLFRATGHRPSDLNPVPVIQEKAAPLAAAAAVA